MSDSRNTKPEAVTKAKPDAATKAEPEPTKPDAAAKAEPEPTKTWEKYKAEPATKADPWAGFSLLNPTLTFYRPYLVIEANAEPIPIELRGITLLRAERAQHDTRDTRQWFYLIQLTAPAFTITRDRDVIVSQPGSIVWVDERAQLRPLRATVPVMREDRVASVTEIGIVPEGTIAIGNDRLLHSFTLRGRKLSPASVKFDLLSPAQASALVRTAMDEAAENRSQSQGGDDDIPF